MAEKNHLVDLAFDKRETASKEDVSRKSGISKEMFTIRAIELGMDPERDTALAWIVRKSFTDSLPENWEEEHDEDGNLFYYNSITDVCEELPIY